MSLVDSGPLSRQEIHPHTHITQANKELATPAGKQTSSASKTNSINKQQDNSKQRDLIVSSLEKKTRTLEGSLKRKAIDYESLSSSAASLQSQLAQSRERVQKLEADRDFFLDDREKSQIKVQEIESTHAASILTLQTRVRIDKLMW
jgi:chromosome segregation ATPase